MARKGKLFGLLLFVPHLYDSVNVLLCQVTVVFKYLMFSNLYGFISVDFAV